MDTLPNDLGNLIAQHLDAAERNLFGSCLSKISVDDAIKSNDWRFILYYTKTAKGIEELLEFAFCHDNQKLYSELYTIAKRHNKWQIDALQLKYGHRLTVFDIYTEKYENARRKIVSITLAEMKGLVRKNDTDTLMQNVDSLPMQFKEIFTQELIKTAKACENLRAFTLLSLVVIGV